MLVQACLNGMRPKSDHPGVPCSVPELVTAARAAVAAGAAELHVHPRAADGFESLAPADIDSWVAALRAACPGTAIGVSTNERIVPDLARRRAAIDGWRVLPDFISVNMAEADAPSIVGRLAQRGVLAEAGLSTVDDARRYLAERGRGMWVKRVLVEPDGADVAAALAEAEAILATLAGAARPAPILMHGYEAGAWPLFDRAGKLGLSRRIGLEDTLVTRDGSTASDNAALLHEALRP